MKDLDAEIEARFYPGSKRLIPTERVVTKAVVEDAWDAKPVMLTVKGVKVEFFTVGQLAQAIGRKPASIRKWETLGIIPKARYRTAASDPAKQKRLYTRAQVEGVVKIAQEEGLMAVSRAGGLRRGAIPKTFTDRVLELWRGL